MSVQSSLDTFESGDVVRVRFTTSNNVDYDGVVQDRNEDTLTVLADGQKHILISESGQVFLDKGAWQVGITSIDFSEESREAGEEDV